MNRKLSPIVFIVITFAAILAFLLVLVSDAVNDTPEDVDVTGFGEEATTDLFSRVAEGFLNSPCDLIFHETNITDARLTNLSSGNYELSTIQLDAADDLPLSCLYGLNDDKAILFRVFSYSADALIDNTRQDLFDRVNTEFIETVIDQGRIGIMDYSFGVSSSNPEECIATIYHPLNDFEVATITYSGFDCANSFNLNREAVNIFGNYLVYLLEDIYVRYGNTTTEELLQEWGYTEYLSGIEFYY